MTFTWQDRTMSFLFDRSKNRLHEVNDTSPLGGQGGDQLYFRNLSQLLREVEYVLNHITCILFRDFCGNSNMN